MLIIYEKNNYFSEVFLNVRVLFRESQANERTFKSREEKIFEFYLAILSEKLEGSS